MKYKVIATKAGYAVQNSITFQIVGVFTLDKAHEVCDNLNRPSNNKVWPEKTYVIGGK